MSARALSKLLISAAVIAPERDIKCCKRTDLPLYVPEKKADECCRSPASTVKLPESSTLEDTIRTIRCNISNIIQEVRKYEDLGKNAVQDGVDNAQWLIDYLGDEENQAPKGPAIAIGGLTGFIFALRGGFIKKVIYTSVGALGMASLCYPKEAREYGSMAVDEGFKYATIAYNFVYGVKKGDPPLELPSLPKVPGSMGEAFATFVDLLPNYTTSSSSSTSQSHMLTDSGAAVVDADEEQRKKVSKMGPCAWVEHQKQTGAYREIIQAEELRRRGADCGEITDEEQLANDEYYEGDACCPCHLGSCMRAGDEDTCPPELPPNCTKAGK